MFIVAVRFYEACANSRIDATWFGNHRINIFTGDGSDPDERPSLVVAPQQYSHEKLHTQSLNLMFAAMGSMASAVYEAAANDVDLRDVNKPAADYNDTDKIIEILYQIRNGFAHRPHSPDWRVSAARRNHYVVSVDGITVDVDFAQLNGQAISPSHFGGYEAFLGMCRHLYEAVRAAIA